MKVISEEKVQRVLDYIKDFQKKEGRSPSFRQIAKGCGFPSLETAQRYTKILESRDLIKKNTFGKIITPFNLSADKTIVAPLVGTVACGTPILAEENIEGSYKLPTAIFGSQETMLLRAKGDSMIKANINNGDLLVVEIRNYADDGEIVVALINDSATVKRLFRKNDRVILHPENPKYKDIVVTQNLIIQGVVKHVIHSF